MKRKIGIIAALVLAFVGVAVLGGNNASAFGRSDTEQYCSIGTADSQLRDCAVVLTYFHASDFDSGGWSLERIKKHVTINVDYNSAYYAGKSVDELKNTAYDELSQWVSSKKAAALSHYKLSNKTGGVATLIKECASAQAGESSCIKAVGNPDKFKKTVGKAAIPICYTDYWSYSQFRDICEGKITPGGGGEIPDPADGGGGGGSVGDLDTDVPGSEKCSTLFPTEWCQADGIGKILTFVVAVLTGTVVIAGTVGIIICAVLILTARDNEQQLALGKKRLMQVIIGMIAWIMFSVLANLFIPKTSTKIDEEINGVIINGGEEKA